MIVFFIHGLIGLIISVYLLYWVFIDWPLDRLQAKKKPRRKLSYKEKVLSKNKELDKMVNAEKEVDVSLPFKTQKRRK